MRKTSLMTTVAALAFASAAPLNVGAPLVNDEAKTLTNRSTDSAAMLPFWNQVDTLIGGITALRNAGETYLPKFVDEDTDSYNYRLKLTKFTNVYRDTVENLAAKPFEEETVIVEDEGNATPTDLAELMEDVDGSGNNLTAFASSTFFNGINNAVDWIFVDFPDENATVGVRTRADQKRAGIRPYWSHVLATNVYDVRSKVVNGKEVLTYIKIYEPGDRKRFRVFERDEGGVILWRTYVESTVTPGEYALEGEGTLSIDVIPLVPFQTGRRDGRRWYWDAALRDAADLSIDLYQRESGLKFAENLTAYPMLVGEGVNAPVEADGKTPKKLAVGPGRVLYGGYNKASGQAGTWKYIEPSATSLKFLSDQVESTIKELRELGRQPLTAQSGNLTVITTAMAANKAKSAVKQWAFALKDALENALVITCKFLNINVETYDPTVFVYVEFDEFIDGKDLESIDADRDRGDISRETLWEEKKRRGVYGPEFDAKRETDRLLAEVPSDGGEDTNDDDPPDETP